MTDVQLQLMNAALPRKSGSLCRMQDLQQKPEKSAASSSDDDSGSGDEAMDGHVSNGDAAVSGAEDDMAVDAPNGHAAHPQAAPRQPIVDADGFQLVQSRRKGRGR